MNASTRAKTAIRQTSDHQMFNRAADAWNAFDDTQSSDVLPYCSPRIRPDVQVAMLVIVESGWGVQL